MVYEKITEQIIGAAISVHRELGPGLLESAYEAGLAYELRASGCLFERQKAIRMLYKGVGLNCGYRLDFLVEKVVVVEVKSIARLDPIHDAQMLSYLKLASCRVGLIINFNETLLRNGIRRLVL